jgi:gluconolactonase
MSKLLFVGLVAFAVVTGGRQAQPPPSNDMRIERLDPALDRLIAPDAKIEVIGQGHDWTEGPLWIKQGRYLLFSDIPKNSIYRWKEGEGERLYL